MIYSLRFLSQLLCLLATFICHSVNGYVRVIPSRIIHTMKINKLETKSFHLYAVPDWLVDQDNDDKVDESNLVNVRFINTANGRDVVTKVEPGSNLLAIGDNAGVSLPRACRTGLCGSCTAEVKDPQAIATKTNPRDGFATIRACSTKCYPPVGMDEMVVDVYRMQNRPEGKRSSGTAGTVTTAVDRSFVSDVIHLLSYCEDK